MVTKYGEENNCFIGTTHNLIHIIQNLPVRIPITSIFIQI